MDLTKMVIDSHRIVIDHQSVERGKDKFIFPKSLLLFSLFHGGVKKIYGHVLQNWFD